MTTSRNLHFQKVKGKADGNTVSMDREGGIPRNELNHTFIYFIFIMLRYGLHRCLVHSVPTGMWKKAPTDTAVHVAKIPQLSRCYLSDTENGATFKIPPFLMSSLVIWGTCIQDCVSGPTSPAVRSPPSSRVIKTRYRIVKKSALPTFTPSPTTAFNPSLNWKTRLLLNRIRQLSPGARFNPSQQRWRSGGLCCIGGVMYRVSANKLSKTWSPGTASKQTPRAGKGDLGSTGSFYGSRSPTSSQYIASRAVQRSLAIIRQAQQKKEKKEYCMYYNRFGKCNRGASCPYIHDPEKVAVCTRFLRGTCKKTDGTCPFSHKVSKDKMPVCSYFLKGACHNNDCPYSHVYVSRKAEVCQDFLKGYCPMGEKCKKKHTLLCPDYARDGTCAKGASCKLQHRAKKKRLENATQTPPNHSGSKQNRPSTQSSGDTERVDVSGACCSDGECSNRGSLRKLPSFISLNCSLTPTSNVMSPDNTSKSAEDTGKPLQIKPRL
ncbi:zinc finger CCCH domain-containing 3 [Pelobates cultripes]|uniref:Zinc finger CCCH domain-containing protein 3 n=1 Tax=Pelobates cultripes TaxID=61616 RepID=A0AAD1W6H4_PELCU|nr:zinc finger CCCH domain-containing 3 [Pelobates cultripes]